MSPLNTFPGSHSILEKVKIFLDGLDEKYKNKIIYNIWKARSMNDKALFKKLQDEIWYFRTKYNKTYYQLFAFWDKSSLSRVIRELVPHHSGRLFMNRFIKSPFIVDSALVPLDCRFKKNQKDFFLKD